VPRALIRPDTLCAWTGPSLLVTTTRGECGPDLPLSGYYFREARFLSACRLEIDGQQLWLCEAASLDPDLLQFSYTFPEVAAYGGGGSGQAGDDEPRNERGLPQRGLNIQLSYRVRIAALEVSASVINASKERLEFELGWHLDTDFADIQEAQEGVRKQHAGIQISRGDRSRVFEYRHRRLPYRTTIELPSDGGWHAAARRVTTRVRLDPQESFDVALTVQPADAAGIPSPDEIAARERFVEEWRARGATICVPRNRQAEAVLHSNIRDSASFPLLDGPRDEWLTMQAGIPLYPAFFGRDAVTAGWQIAIILSRRH
jgi:N-terminal domain of (some) glycogen debranching enzymes